MYATEDVNGLQQIVVQAAEGSIPAQALEHCPGVFSVQPFDLPAIDWQEQWSNHSQYYRDGLLSLDLSLFGPASSEELLLGPGPGFGDLSHPTTRLVLRLMSEYVRDHTVVDVGCGSGILSLAAAKWGASKVWAIEICPDAIKHAQANAERNHLQNNIVFIDVTSKANPSPFKLSKSDRLLIVMNMIDSEQQQALASLPELQGHSAHWITSGILKEQQDAYIETCSKRGWLLREVAEEEGWLAMHFESAANALLSIKIT